jgi:hypothetical protein
MKWKTVFEVKTGGRKSKRYEGIVERLRLTRRILLMLRICWDHRIGQMHHSNKVLGMKGLSVFWVCDNC